MIGEIKFEGKLPDQTIIVPYFIGDKQLIATIPHISSKDTALALIKQMSKTILQTNLMILYSRIQAEIKPGKEPKQPFLEPLDHLLPSAAMIESMKVRSFDQLVDNGASCEKLITYFKVEDRETLAIASNIKAFCEKVIAKRNR